MGEIHGMQHSGPGDSFVAVSGEAQTPVALIGAVLAILGVIASGQKLSTDYAFGLPACSADSGADGGDQGARHAQDMGQRGVRASERGRRGSDGWTTKAGRTV
jgi:hypothetical protein